MAFPGLAWPSGAMTGGLNAQIDPTKAVRPALRWTEEILHHPKRDAFLDPRAPHLTLWQAQRVLLCMVVQDFRQWRKFKKHFQP